MSFAFKGSSVAGSVHERSLKENNFDTFQSSNLLAVVLAVLVDLPDAVLQLPDFSYSVSDKQ